MSSETSRSGEAADTTEAVDAADATKSEGYVHRPGGIQDDETDTSTEPYTGKPEGEGFGRSGWLLVAGVVVCFLVIPGFIYLNPTAPAQIGWTFFATFLVLPLIPAVILGLLAVWSMQAAA